jgi:hypothetical protein
MRGEILLALYPDKDVPEGCRKAGKIWTRLDSVKQHVDGQHKDADIDSLVREQGSDASLIFSVTTPTSIARKRRSKRTGIPRD